MARNDGNLSTPSNNKPGHEKECKGKTAQLREAGPFQKNFHPSNSNWKQDKKHKREKKEIEYWFLAELCAESKPFQPSKKKELRLK